MFQSAYESLGCTISGWVIWSTLDMFDSVLFEEISKFCVSKLWSVIRN